jgi:hypothetical protein
MAKDDAVETNVPSPPLAADLSKAIEQSADRQPDESIKAVRVFDNYYRCNWRVLDKSPNAFWLATGTIRKSRLLRATMTSNGLNLEDMTLTGKQP